MEVKFLGTSGTWQDVKDNAMNTVGKDTGKAPSREWKRFMLRSEHSPIRELEYKWKWIDLPYWVSVHFVRHWLGILHWVKSQRADRTGEARNGKPQDAPVNHTAKANAQALINISRKRLCSQASRETIQAWIALKEEVKAVDPEMAEAMVPECIYRGFCPEMHSCGFYKTEAYKRWIRDYRKGINDDMNDDLEDDLK